MSVNVFICLHNGLILWVSVKFCAENHYSSELMDFSEDHRGLELRIIPLLLAASVAFEMCNNILILTPFHITYFTFSF